MSQKQNTQIYLHDLHFMSLRTATSSYRGHVDELATELSLLRTTCMEQAAETDLTLMRSTDSFRRKLETFLFDRVLGHQGTGWLVLLCALGVLVGGAI